MSLGTVHAVAENLRVIEGHQPRRVWEDPDIPSIAVYDHGRILYLLDSGVGPGMREAVLNLADRLGPLDEVVLLNSHGHLDHLGNNSVIDAIPADTRRHFMPAAGRPALDSGGFFGEMFCRGLSYFDHLDGLTVDLDAIRSLLVGLGAPSDLSTDAVAAAAESVVGAGLRPVLGSLIPAVMIEALLRNYPPVGPGGEGMLDHEDLHPAEVLDVGGTSWPGWSLGNGAVRVLTSGGHSAGGCISYVAEHGFLMLADETTTAPIWADSDPSRTVAAARRALHLLDQGAIRTVCAGQRPDAAGVRAGRPGGIRADDLDRAGVPDSGRSGGGRRRQRHDRQAVRRPRGRRRYRRDQRRPPAPAIPGLRNIYQADPAAPVPADGVPGIYRSLGRRAVLAARRASGPQELTPMDRWTRFWVEIAGRHLAAGDDHLGIDEFEAACAAYLRSVEYYALALAGPVDGADRRTVKDLCVSAFQAAAPLLPHQATAIGTTQGGATISGYLFEPGHTASAHLALVNEVDAGELVEAGYLTVTRPSLDAGAACVVVDVVLDDVLDGTPAGTPGLGPAVGAWLRAPPVMPAGRVMICRLRAR